MAVETRNYVEIRDGKLCLAGSRVTVEDIAALYVWNDSSPEWIVENYDVTLAQIYGALAYYYDHKDQIDREMAEAEELAHQIAIPSDELLAKMRARQQKPAE